MRIIYVGRHYVVLRIGGRFQYGGLERLIVYVNIRHTIHLFCRAAQAGFRPGSVLPIHPDDLGLNPG